MRVAIVAAGTRGDVAPQVALARALDAAGHEALVATHERHRPLVEAVGADFALLPGDPDDIFTSREWRTLRVTRRHPLRHVRTIHALIGSLLADVRVDELTARCRGSDVVLGSPTSTFAFDVARALDLPAALAAVGPVVATSAFAHPVLAPGLRLGGPGNRLSWLVGERLQRQTFREPWRPDARRRLGLPANPLRAPRGTREHAWPPHPVLAAMSPSVVPRPADWPDHVHQTGWWLAPDAPAAPLPDAVEAFLARGEPPVSLGFGSMVPRDPPAFGRAVRAALRATGRRAIVTGALAGAIEADDDLLALPAVPHGPLLGRVAAVVHHGGSGTTAAGLRAGRPTVVVPFVFDQFFWADRVRRLGVGPPPVPAGDLDAAALEAALRGAERPEVHAAAEALGRRVAAEDGVGAAVAVLERLGRSRRTAP